MSFKEIICPDSHYFIAPRYTFIFQPFAQPPIGPLRFEPPVPSHSESVIDASNVGPACLQQFGVIGGATLSQILLNTPALAESENYFFLSFFFSLLNIGLGVMISE